MVRLARTKSVMAQVSEGAKKFKTYLKANKISIDRCARLIEANGVTVWRYTTGLREPTGEMKERILERLGYQWPK